MTGEERERKMLEDQIARAKVEAEAAESEAGPSELQKRDGEKISLNLFGTTPQPAANGTPIPTGSATSAEGSGSKAPASTTGFMSFGSLPSAPTPIANPLKRPAPMNVFKSAKTPKSDPDANSGMGKQRQLSEVERLMKEDQARKARAGYQGQGPRRG